MKKVSGATFTCPEALAAAAVVFKALGHPTRLMVVATLGKGERCVFDLAELVGCDMSTMSNHLSTLRSAGVVSAERRASKVFYRIARPCVLDVLRCLVDRDPSSCNPGAAPCVLVRPDR
jgi:DNA-binding transcriptional ArsR family regulator